MLHSSQESLCTLFWRDYPVLRVKELKNLAFFLNTVTPDMTESQWIKFCEAAKKRALFATPFASPHFTDKVSLTEAKGLRAEIARDLIYRDKDPDAPMASLLGSLDRLELKTKYQCMSLEMYGPRSPWQKIIKVGKKSFVPLIRPEALTVKELLYVTLGAALMDGTLDRLKRCKRCGKWIAGKTTGRKFCSSRCKDNFNNEQRRADGTFAHYRKLKRLAFEASR
jgi:predicted nucleic acid-binding Zn ribbon protein